MNFLYFNQDGQLRCNPLTTTTETFTQFSDSIIKLQKGKHIVCISIHCDVDEKFYEAIDKSNDYFVDSPFNITVTIGQSTETYNLCQYTPIDIQLTRVLDLQEDTNIVISSNYNDYTSVNINTSITTV